MNQVREEGYVSFSQINTYMMCPLKYRFMYVDQTPPAFTPCALSFGGAIHEAVAHYYRNLLQNQVRVTVDDLIEVFNTDWQLRLQAEEVRFGENESPQSLLEQGMGLLRCFHEQVQPQEIVAVEAEFKLRQRNPESGVVLPVPIVGVIDLVERDGAGRITVVDLKTAARSYQESKVRQDLQLTLYSEVVKHSKLANGASEIACRFDVLLKTKKPAMVSYPTVRTDDDRRRMFKTINEILHAFEAGIYYPNSGWACDNCQYQPVCERW